MMTTYTIENTASGVVLGTYEAESAETALDAMARDAGYADYAACCAEAPAADREIVVSEAAQ